MLHETCFENASSFNISLPWTVLRTPERDTYRIVMPVWVKKEPAEMYPALSMAAHLLTYGGLQVMPLSEEKAHGRIFNAQSDDTCKI